ILCDLPPPPPGRPTQRGPFSATSDGHIVRAHTQPSSPRYRAKCTPFSLVLSVTGHPHTGTHTDTHTPAHTHTGTHTDTHTHAHTLHTRRHTHADTHTHTCKHAKVHEHTHTYKHNTIQENSLWGFSDAMDYVLVPEQSRKKECGSPKLFPFMIRITQYITAGKHCKK